MKPENENALNTSIARFNKLVEFRAPKSMIGAEAIRIAKLALLDFPTDMNLALYLVKKIQEDRLIDQELAQTGVTRRLL